MNNADVLHRTLQRQCDDRGYVRATVDELAVYSGLSRSTVKRALTQLVACGLIRQRSKDGAGGGVLIRLETGSETGSKPVQKPVQTEPVHHVVTHRAGPEGALSPVLVHPETGSPTGSARPVAHRQAHADEVPVSGAELVYTGDTGTTKWRRVGPTLWEAPNGDTVSVRSMSPALRQMLRVDENDDGTRNVEAIRAIRGIVDA